MKKIKGPPRLARRLLAGMSTYDLKHGSTGDFEEYYHKIAHGRGRRKAAAWYWRQVLSSLIPYLFLIVKWRFAMIKNYLIVALRQFRKYKGYSLINIAGLAIGIACSLFIFLFVQEELSYDNYHPDLDRIHRVALVWETQSASSTFATIGPCVGHFLRQDFPQVETVARLKRFGSPLVKRGDRIFYEDLYFFAEPELFEVLSFDFLKGDPKSALSDPNTMVITRRIAEKYFDRENPIGKTLTFNSQEFHVTGVIENPRSNSHLKGDFFLSFKSFETDRMSHRGSMGWTTFYTYVKLKPNVDPSEFEKQIAHFNDNYFTQAELQAAGVNVIYFLQPVRDIHMQSRLTYSEMERAGSVSLLVVISAIGLFILLIACINFMNLSTARFTTRAKEVGLRKVVGADRRQLIGQFLGESAIMTVMAFLLSLAVLAAVLPLLNELLVKEFNLMDLLTLRTMILCILLVGFVTLAAGGWPAFALSHAQPSSTFRPGSGLKNRSSMLRNTLVVGQFSVSIFLLIGALIVNRQIHAMKNAELGIDKQQKLVLSVAKNDADLEYFQMLKSEFVKIHNVIGASVSSLTPGRGLEQSTIRIHGVPEDMAQVMNFNYIDHEFLELFGIPLAAGRNFDVNRSDDVRKSYILNEAAVRAFGWQSPDQAVGRLIRYDLPGPVIGVVKDFHYAGLQDEIAPLVMPFRSGRFNTMTLSLESGDLNHTIARIQAKWEQYFPGGLFRYRFVDEQFDRYYRMEEKVYKTFGFFTFLGMFIACLGLFGLAAFTAELKTKEIGIRKILGAQVPGILFLLSKDFAKWVMAANLIAWPAAYYAMWKWLRSFAYRIEIGPLPFFIAGAAAFMIALITVSFQAVRAALADPVRSLRYE